MVIDLLEGMKDRSTTIPYCEETEALEHVTVGRKGRRHWMLVRAAVREARSFLALDEERERRRK